MKKARTNDLQSWQQRQPPSSSMPSMQQQPSQMPFANHPAWYSTQHYGQPDMTRREPPMDFRYGAPPPPQPQQQQQHHAAQTVQPSMTHPPQPQAPAPQQQPPAPAPAPTPRSRKRQAPGAHPAAHAPQPHSAQHAPQHAPQHPPQHAPQHAPAPPPQPQPVQAQTAVAPQPVPQTPAQQAPSAVAAPAQTVTAPPQAAATDDASSTPGGPQAKKSRTNTPWTPQEELRLKQMRDAGNSWAEIAKTFPTRTEGSVKKHWYKDMHYAEFAEDESQALLNAIKEYENNKWKTIGQKVGKPAKACEQYAKEHFPEHFAAQRGK